MSNQEELNNRVQESRVVSAADNVIFPLINKKKQARMDLACSKFTAGETNFIADIAYIQGLKEIESELKKMIMAGNQADYDLNKENLK